ERLAAHQPLRRAGDGGVIHEERLFVLEQPPGNPGQQRQAPEQPPGRVGGEEPPKPCPESGARGGAVVDHRTNHATNSYAADTPRAPAGGTCPRICGETVAIRPSSARKSRRAR